MSAGPADVAAAYSAAAAGWASGPELIYGRLADLLVASSPEPLVGCRVLDIGAGTGAASRAVIRAGGAPVALDVAHGMLSWNSAHRPPSTVGDALALPLRTGVMDAVVAAFCLNHVTDPVAGLREAARVTLHRGPVLASSYATDDSHPVKAVVEQAASELGWRPPGWYQAVRESAVPLLAEPDLMRRCALAAGLSDVRVEAVRVPFPELSVADLIAWRLGLSQLAPWLDRQPPECSARLSSRAGDLLGVAPPPLVRSVLLLSARA